MPYFQRLVNICSIKITNVWKIIVCRSFILAWAFARAQLHVSQSESRQKKMRNGVDDRENCSINFGEGAAQRETETKRERQKEREKEEEREGEKFNSRQKQYPRTVKMCYIVFVDMECRFYGDNHRMNVFVLIFVALTPHTLQWLHSRASHHSICLFLSCIAYAYLNVKLPYHYPQHLISFNNFFLFTHRSCLKHERSYIFYIFFYCVLTDKPRKTSILSNDCQPHTHTHAQILHTYYVCCQFSFKIKLPRSNLTEHIIGFHCISILHTSIYSIFPERNWFFFSFLRSFVSLFFLCACFSVYMRSSQVKNDDSNHFPHIHTMLEASRVSESCGESRKKCGWIQ